MVFNLVETRLHRSGGRGLALGAWALGLAAVLGADPAFALDDDESQTASAAVEVAADDRVTPYQADFFSEFRPVTALDMIYRIPGFQFDGGTSARGMAGTQGNVLIDGDRPPTRSDTLYSILARIPASQVLRIELVRGGAGGIDMQGKAVVANVIRKPDAGVSGAVSVGANLVSTGDIQPNLYLQIQQQRGGRSLEGSLQLYHGPGAQNGYRIRTAPDGTVLLRALSTGDYMFDQAEATGVYEGPLAGGRLRANGLFSYNGSDYAFTDLLVIPFGREDSVSQEETFKGEMALRWTRSLPRGATLELVGSQQLIHSTSDGLYDTPDFTSQSLSDEDRGESILNGSVQFASLNTPLGAWSFETGSEAALNWVESDTAYRFNGDPLLLPGDDTRVEELRSESFITGVWAARPNLSLETTLRYEASRITATGSAGEGETTLSFLKPRLNLGWTPKPGHQWNFKAERNAEQLSFGSFQASASFSTGVFGRGNPDIRPAQTWLAQARYERVYDKQGAFTAELTHEWIDDVLGSVIVTEIPPGETDPVTFTITRNVADATRDTLKLTNRLPLDRFGWTGGMFNTSATWRRSQTRDPITLEERRLSSEQPFLWSLSLSRNLTAQRISWTVGASSGGEGRSYGARTLSSWRSDPFVYGSFSYRPDDTLSLSADLNVSQPSESRFRLFEGVRGASPAAYDEVNFSQGQIQASVSLRRSF
ncbi:TonB-dependent receptor plug domain-containing protein [Brevundimonas goettingensis]|uniref:TonB-dependent receptor n=1 Tax=Brevundimonas goettingensis TaxID=2774190 RepID=A0A975C6M3_9CAUL|nr:hypothetical protein [Brevundimonas goettingensis]QTC92940.1 hypothetical protein IFJ75_08900 [Brevundimonas goettingensis]